MRATTGLAASGQRRRKGRRGVAVLVVLLLIAITLAVSYATMRAQSMGLMIQQNASLGAAARQAAFTGMTIGLKQMHTGGWVVDSVPNGSLGEGTSYEVTYATGDPSLSENHLDYSDLPYRVTLLATGEAVDPNDPGRVVTHEIRVVVRLVPRDLGPQPIDWAEMQNYTVYQSKNGLFQMDIPSRIEGLVRALGTVMVAVNYPDGAARQLYLDHLNAMSEDLQLDPPQDYRPLTDQVVQQSEEVAADFTKPVWPSSYQIYQGGPVYFPEELPSSPVGTYEPDPENNPLGLFYRERKLTIGDNVTIRGSLICRDDVHVEGINVHFESVDLPTLHPSDAPLRLPVVSCRSFFVEAGAGGSLTGLLAAFKEFRVNGSPDTVTFLVTGRVITPEFVIAERQPWGSENWSGHFSDFMSQLANASLEPYFPVWLHDFHDLDPNPLIRIVPDPTPVDYRWKMSYDTIFLPHPSDASPQDPDNPGLRWDLLEWTDRP